MRAVTGADPPQVPERTILVVEDDARVRRAAARILIGAGYRVLEAEAEVHAMPLLDESPDLLLCDVVLPGAHGLQLVHEAERRLPAIQVVLMSGYAREALVRDHGLEADTALLLKPFTPQPLIAHVEARLGPRG